MKKSTKAILVGAILSITVAAAYVALSADRIALKKTDYYRNRALTVGKYYNIYFTDKSPSNEEIRKFVLYSSDKIDDLFFVAAFDQISQMTAFQGNHSRDEIAKDYQSGALIPKQNESYLKKFYGGVPVLVFVLNTAPYRIVAAFPDKLPRGVFMSSVFEITAIVSFVIILCAVLYVRGEKGLPSRKSSAKNHIRESENTTIDEKPALTPIEQNIREKLPTQNEGLKSVKISGEEDVTASKGFSPDDLFNEIFNKHAISVASLYIHNDSIGIIKQSEKVFNSQYMYEENMSEGLIDELKNNSTIIQNNGCQVILPVIRNGSFMGALVISSGSRINGKQIEDIRRLSEGLRF